jgi:quercetin dioxygenase-like cupin family protein
MPFLDLATIAPFGRLPGWRGLLFESETMTFAEWTFSAGAEIRRHAHEQEEVWQVLAGELDITIGDETRRAGPGLCAIVPPGVEHRIVAATDGVARVVDTPVRRDMRPPAG